MDDRFVEMKQDFTDTWEKYLEKQKIVAKNII